MCDFTVEPVEIGGVRAEWVTANDVTGNGPIVLYFHGGAYMCGHPEQYRNATVWLSRTANARVLAPDYHLAPEHPFPAAFDDALNVYRWLITDAGVAPGQFVVAGDSAGGAIAVSVAADAFAVGLPLPACIITNSPFADLALSSPSLDNPKLNTSEPTKATIEWVTSTYLEAGGADPLNPRHSPVYRDLTGLPPLLIQVGGLDNLHDDGMRLAAQARSCGVDTTYSDYAESGHIWIVYQPADVDREAARAVDEMSRFIQNNLPAQAPS